MSRLRRNIFIWLSGGDPEVLSVATISEKRKFIKLGLVLLIPAILGWLGMWFASSYIGIENITGKLAVSVIWSLIIVILDIYLVSTLDKRLSQNNKNRYYGLILIRLFISFFIGLIMSHPIVLKILESNINQEMLSMKEQAVRDINTNNEEYSNTQNLRRTNERASIIDKINCTELLLENESNGVKSTTACGSSGNIIGTGLRWIEFKNQIRNLEKSRDSVAVLITESRNNAAIRTAAEIDSFRTHYSVDYLKRVSALQSLTEKDIRKGEWLSHTKVVTWLLIIFFILLDSIAIISKAIIPVGHYEALFSRHERYLWNISEKEYDTQERLVKETANLAAKTKSQLIKAIYGRSGNFKQEEIQQAINSVLSSGGVSSRFVTNLKEPQIILNKFIFLIGSIFLGLITWYVLGFFKVSENAMSIAMGMYCMIIPLFAQIFKMDYGK